VWPRTASGPVSAAIHHRRTERVRAHMLICTLARYLVWHLRKAWAPVTFTDEHPPQQHNPVAAAQRSPTPGQSLNKPPRQTRNLLPQPRNFGLAHEVSLTRP
jgi:hypothetical protein